MNTCANRIYSRRKANIYSIYSALVFSLAVLLLVVSCPVKRALQSGFASHASPVSRTNQTNINEQTNAGIDGTANCLTFQKKTVFVTSGWLQKVQIAIPFYFSDVANATGFDIYDYLSRLQTKPAHVISFNTSSLPLYLQHLRLLI